MDIAFWDDEFSEKLEDLKASIAALGNLQGPAKSQALKKCETRVSDITNKTRRTFCMEMRQLGRESKTPYQQKLDKYDQDLQKLKVELQWASKDALMGGRKEVVNTSTDGVTRDTMLQQTHVVQDKTEQSLARSLAEANEMNQIGEETLVKMNEQTDQIKKINEQLDNMDSELSKAEDIMKSMIRRMMTDKLVLLFIGLIIFGILGIIIYVAVKPEQGHQQFNIPPQVVPGEG
mmetsp:Transcript_16939/g.20907  ORF Transcript_16939/g.20907 Transcript_16939/m.20907 type:complete len:233 (+) Transcript_16939:82-780(+)|eukprot:CAMPEP_0204831482 /NCGR_PEP_ID=MMETSP1346-20131115/10807_1 /ASSEMBLY_ACC=CAM_ASM_000771 /TAXON_ID=215587 /ORGANISM="Aplanochytrium stocchinoi, Strain GSBS06" /LENGTH=232 /DNA_ID=CAMNT_0051962567 /DNA_START=301 /DNA_END=999 /DNA_ORIENTATION=-